MVSGEEGLLLLSELLGKGELPKKNAGLEGRVLEGYGQAIHIGLLVSGGN